MDQPTVVLFDLTIDGAISAVLAARALGDECQLRPTRAEKLPDFFEESVQSGLPASCELVVCALEVVHKDWDGELIRPRLMEGLRGFAGPMRWFSAEPWHPEDVAAVGHLVGADKLVVSENVRCAAELVQQHLLPEPKHYEQRLVATILGPEKDWAEWQGNWRSVITALKAKPEKVGEALSVLVEGRPELLSDELVEHANKVEQENHEFAEQNASDPLEMRANTMITIDIPPERHCFWSEISSHAIRLKETDFCLCRLVGRPVVILTRSDECRIDLRRWVRYLTDLLPPAESLGNRAHMVPVVIRGLTEDPGLKQEAINLLKDGSHLLQSG